MYHLFRERKVLVVVVLLVAFGRGGGGLAMRVFWSLGYVGVDGGACGFVELLHDGEVGGPRQTVRYLNGDHSAGGDRRGRERGRDGEALDGFREGLEQRRVDGGDRIVQVLSD